MKILYFLFVSLIISSNLYGENEVKFLSDNHMEKYIICDVHIDEWPSVKKAGVYAPDSIKKEGFIHCAKPSQFSHVTEKYFNGETRVLFVINPEFLSSPLKYEGSDPTNRYPHIYGPLPLSEVYRTVIVSPRSDGTYQLPGHLKSRSKLK